MWLHPRVIVDLLTDDARRVLTWLARGHNHHHPDRHWDSEGARLRHVAERGRLIKHRLVREEGGFFVPTDLGLRILVEMPFYRGARRAA